MTLGKEGNEAGRELLYMKSLSVEDYLFWVAGTEFGESSGVGDGKQRSKG